MIITPKMFTLEKQIEQLEWLIQCDPNDYMLEFELIELKDAYSNERALLRRSEFKVVKGGNTRQEVRQEKLAK